MQKTILIIGGTGTIGKPVAEKLKGSGFSIRILARNKNKANRILGNEYQIVEGDVTDTRTLESALEGCYGVHISLAGEIEQIGVENIVKIAKEKRIERITYISGTSVAKEYIWFPQTKRKFFAEKAIKESGITYTIFCPTWFMESLPRYIKGDKAFAFGKQPNPYHFLAADDFAEMVVKSYTTDKANNKRLTIHGPEGILFHDALRQYCSVFHPEIKKITTLPYWLAGIIAAIKGSKQMKTANEFMEYFEKVGELGDPTEANSIFGPLKTTLSEWLKLKKSGKT